MNKKIFIVFILIQSFGLSKGQIKLKDIRVDLSTINKIDHNGRQGLWFFYDRQDSTIISKQHYLNDTLNGYFENYWFNGQISEKGFYKKGILDSLSVSYWENGERRAEINYTNGILNGITTTFNTRGEITSRIKYNEGNTDSNYIELFVDSNVSWENKAVDKIDTIKTYLPSVWNKVYAIYINDSLCKEMKFYKDMICIENFYDNTLLKKRIVYTKKKPYRIEKIFYFEKEKLVKTEYYNKKGKARNK